MSNCIKCSECSCLFNCFLLGYVFKSGQVSPENTSRLQGIAQKCARADVTTGFDQVHL